MIATLKKFAPVLTAAALIAAAGCGEKGTNSEQLAADTGLSPNSPDVVYPKDWNEIDIDAYSSNMVIDSTGHFKTDNRVTANACNKHGDGVYDLATWNDLARAANLVVASAPLTTPRCWDSPAGSKFYNNGTAEIVVTHPTTSKRKLFEYKNAQICTYIADPDLANTLMSAIETLIPMADKAATANCGGQ
jgi:hypothetical protein